MSKHRTSFVKIGQSGPTVDGRAIEAQWLLDMAETYDPDVYTALIWPEHLRWSGNFGKVTGVKAETGENGLVSLYAELAPNASYFWENQWGQKLFFSMEIEPNFAGSGRAYLCGLAVTDSPASLGTEEMRFSARKQKPENLFIGNVPCGFLDSPDGEEQQAPAWFRRFFSSLFSGNTRATNGPKWRALPVLVANKAVYGTREQVQTYKELFNL